VQAEKHVSDMVVAAALYAKIDRPAGIVRFAKRQDPDELLNKWSNNLAKLLEVVERSCQQIQKESMVQRFPLVPASSQLYVAADGALMVL